MDSINPDMDSTNPRKKIHSKSNCGNPQVCTHYIHNRNQNGVLTGIVTMVVCCRCNSGGRCRKCTCVKADHSCSNCLPSRKSTCENVNSVSFATAFVLTTVTATTTIDVQSFNTQIGPLALFLILCLHTSIPMNSR